MIRTAFRYRISTLHSPNNSLTNQQPQVHRTKTFPMDFQPPTRSTDQTLQILTHNQYNSQPLSPSSVLPSPLDQFRNWIESALRPSPEDGTPAVQEPEAMSLATVSKSGIPSVRMVLLKQVDTEGFVFSTNYNSRKSQELKENPHAALAFHWKEVSRQVRVVGRVERMSEEASKEYYDSRPVSSRIGAWASNQSSVVEEGEVHRRFTELEEQFKVKDGNTEIPKPDFWGGWRLIPDEVEFWAGKPSRLHDRVRYLRIPGTASWKIERLAP